MAVKKTYKLDIFKTLTRISKKDTNFFIKLSEEESKAFQPLVVMRWLTGTTSSRQIVFINEFVNPLVFSLGQQHKGLLYDLMTICCNGQPQRYQWTKAQSKKSTSSPLTISVIKQYYKYNTLHAIDALKLLTNDDVLEIAEELGRQKEDISKIKKELKLRK